LIAYDNIEYPSRCGVLWQLPFLQKKIHPLMRNAVILMCTAAIQRPTQIIAGRHSQATGHPQLLVGNDTIKQIASD